MDLHTLNKKYIFVFISLMISVLYLGPAISLAHESQDEDTLIIHISENGFEPNRISIEIGTQVIFENTGVEEHWPASDDHPSHTLYDGTSLEEHCSLEKPSSFDACKPMKSGEMWPFTFTEEGMYKYHDHLWPQFTGHITVSDSGDAEPRKRTFFIGSRATCEKYFLRYRKFFPETRKA